MPLRRAVLAAIAACYATAGWSAIVECTDARGVSILTSDADGSGCAKAMRPASRRAPQAMPVSASPADFPRVDRATQRARDSDRVLILKDELAREQERLVATENRMRAVAVASSARSSPPDATTPSELVDLLARTRENIRALQTELAGAR